jgi:hypothetical protein
MDKERTIWRGGESLNAHAVSGHYCVVARRPDKGVFSFVRRHVLLDAHRPSKALENMLHQYQASGKNAVHLTN